MSDLKTTFNPDLIIEGMKEDSQDLTGQIKELANMPKELKEGLREEFVNNLRVNYGKSKEEILEDLKDNGVVLFQRLLKRTALKSALAILQLKSTNEHEEE